MALALAAMPNGHEGTLKAAANSLRQNVSKATSAGPVLAENIRLLVSLLLPNGGNDEDDTTAATEDTITQGEGGMAGPARGFCSRIFLT